MKRILACIISLCMVVGILTSCSTPSTSTTSTTKETQKETTTTATTTQVNEIEYLNLDSTYPIVKEGFDVTVSVISVHSFLMDPKEHWLWNHFEKNANLKTDVVYYEPTGWGEQKNLIFSSNELPDMFYNCGFSREEIMKYGQIEGMFMDLKPLIQEYAPLIQSEIGQDELAIKACTTPDGSMYTLPAISKGEEYEVSSPRHFINQVWLNNVGMSNPETLDQLADVLKAFKNNDPNGNGLSDEVPLVSTYDKGYSFQPAILTALGMNSYSTSNPYIKEDGKTIGIPFMEAQYVEYLKYMNMLLKEGLLDQDYFTLTAEQARAKMAGNLVGVANMSAPFVETPDYYKDFISLNPLTSSLSNKKVAPLGDPVTIGQFTISYDSEYPELLIRFANTHFTPDTTVLFWTGQYEGYEYVIDGWGVTTMEPREGGLGEIVMPIGEMGVWDWLTKTVRPIYGGVPFGHTDYNATAEKIFGMKRIMSDVEKTWRDSYKQVVTPYGKLSMSNLYYQPDKLERKNALETPIMDYLKTMESKFIMGTEPIENIDKFIAQMKSLGIDEYMSIIQEAFSS